MSILHQCPPLAHPNDAPSAHRASTHPVILAAEVAYWLIQIPLAVFVGLAAGPVAFACNAAWAIGMRWAVFGGR